MTYSIRKRQYKNGYSYQIVFDRGKGPDGKRIREYVSCETLREAKSVAAERVHLYDEGTYIEPKKMTVKQLCDEWFNVHVKENLAINTQKGYRVNLDNHVLPYIGSVPVQKLTPLQVQNMYKALKDKGLSPRSIHYVHTTLHSALHYAYKLQIISRNVTDFVTLPKQERFRPDIYSEEEMIRLLEACMGTFHEIPINLAAGLGLRRGEVFGLKWEDINFADGTVHICHNLVCVDGKKSIFSPKTASSDRVLLMPDYLITMLREHKTKQMRQRLQSGGKYENNDLVCCCTDGTPVHTGSYSERFCNFLERNKLRHIRFHDLRHLNATVMLARGVPMKIASERLGHSTINITMDTYSHVTVDMQKDAAQQLNDAFSVVANEA